MRLLLTGLLLLICGAGYNYSPSGSLSQDSQSKCPKIWIEAPIYVDQRVLPFKVHLSGGDCTLPTPTYKWAVHGGEIKEGQATTSITVINFDVCKKTVTALIDVGGLPEGCSSTASASISVRCIPGRQ